MNSEGCLKYVFHWHSRKPIKNLSAVICIMMLLMLFSFYALLLILVAILCWTARAVCFKVLADMLPASHVTADVFYLLPYNWLRWLIGRRSSEDFGRTGI